MYTVLVTGYSSSCTSKGDKDVARRRTIGSCFIIPSPSPPKKNEKEAEALKAIQAVLGFPKIKIVKPSDTRWLSHEQCVQFARNFLVVEKTIYESSGDSEAIGISSLWASVNSNRCITQLSPIRSSQCPCSFEFPHAKEDS